jgi:hypothetical protein
MRAWGVKSSETADRWWSVRWTRVVLWIVIVWVGLCVLMLPAAHIMSWYTAKSTVADNPSTALQVQPLPDTRIADLKGGLMVSRFGYSLQVPWAEVKTQNDYKTVSVMRFEDGSSLIIEDPGSYVDMLSAKPAREAESRKAWGQLLGSDAVASHYDFAKLALQALPTEISLFHSRRRNARAAMLLLMKSLDIPDQATAIYGVSAPHIRGFQFGDPKKLPTYLELLLFDEHDRALKLTFRGPKGGTQPVLTQEQVNAIIASVQGPN